MALVSYADTSLGHHDIREMACIFKRDAPAWTVILVYALDIYHISGEYTMYIRQRYNMPPFLCYGIDACYDYLLYISAEYSPYKGPRLHLPSGLLKMSSEY